MRVSKHTLSAALSLVGVVVMAVSAAAEGPMPHMGNAIGASGQSAPISITMEDLHAQGGVPHGWRFLLPGGDAAAGRKVFAAMECFACHEVKGETFSGDAHPARRPGPALTGMGAHHPAEYFAESIVNPNRVIVRGSGYTGPDGLSTMPSYAESMTVRQLVDVVAYLRSLREGETTGHHQGDPGMAHGSMKMH